MATKTTALKKIISKLTGPSNTKSKTQAKATKTQAKTQAKATKSPTTGSKALKAIDTAATMSSLALTGLMAYSLVDEAANPEEPEPFIDDTGLPGDELPLYTEDPELSSDTGLFDTGLGGAYNAAEQTAEEILEPLAEVPVVGDIVSGAAENGLSLPLILGIVAAVGAFAYFAYKKTVKKSGNRKSSAKKTPKHKAKGAAA